MQTRRNSKNGQDLSILAFGCMRFDKDEKETDRQVAYAIERGINYFDTAYIYAGNEERLGRLLSVDGRRQRVNIATKLPRYFVRGPKDFDKLFETERKRLKTDRVDYYLIHMLPDTAEWARLCELGAREWIEKKKREGSIGNIGFSCHSGTGAFCGLIDAYPWDFSMIQYNYLDEFSQAGRQGLHYATQKGVPVMIMEPLRGGRLVNLPSAAAAAWAAYEPVRSPAEWGLRWLWNQSEPLTVLSGMNTMAMLEENIRVANDARAGALSEADLAQYAKVRDIILENTFVACTGCNYCMPCPQGVDIPLCFSSYNDMRLVGKGKARRNYMLRVSGHQASRCNKCGRCEKHCPQGIPIREKLSDAARDMEGFPYGQIGAVVGRFMHPER